MTGIASARTFLFVPANRPERYAKALASGAGAVIIDLEDAVAPDAKVAARQQLTDGFNALPATERSRVLVRINAAGTPWHADDLALVEMLAMLGLGGVVLPKAESVADLVQLAAMVGPGCAVLPLIESAAGFAALDLLATCPGVTRLVFGNLDFQADLGMACGPDEAELQPVRLGLVLASRRAGLPAPVDGVTPATGDTAQLQQDAARSRRSGFGARLCIHPSQVAVVQAALAPTKAERDWAQRVIEGSRQAGGAVFTIDGRMVDTPVLRLAERTLADETGK
ncbi:HpcH/HpaI aldolase/citrate lyase family protein [Polaromonas eurypsychrophila]|uniref:CoA ester lyase n=1 Tax=Polaromonas eurypsychrophila TaxID=1614635 RepID=A0A916WMD0_9BURK|nr:CoA ester lyase [Polaromonas eurypsychrophila]GGB11622.1 CoA ester lyase [Polaromonas eurypsychrophila]